MMPCLQHSAKSHRNISATLCQRLSSHFYHPLFRKSYLDILLEHYLVLNRGLRSGLCPTDVSTFEQLIDSQDEQLFDAILANQNHVLHQLLSPLSDASQRYTLRPRGNRQLPDYSFHRCQFNFINRLCVQKLLLKMFL